MIKVLFVCLGNICRSPMAEAIFQQQVKDAGLAEKIMLDSAGTGSWHVGEQAHQGTRDILKRNNISYNGRARRLAARDLSDFDYVLAMDNSNLNNIKPYMSDEQDTEVRLFLSYGLDAATVDVSEMPDPYYDNRFEDVYELVQKGSKALLEHIRKTHDF
jgi:low molecular weight protein-tyrosine phosphatase